MDDCYESELKPISCANCDKVPPKLLVCTACRAVKYCNVECQRDDWRPCHKAKCKVLLRRKKLWEGKARIFLEKMNDATGMYILAVQLAVGDNTTRNHELACELYEAAARLERPIAGGHPNAMLHLAIHYERGIGVEQDYEEAFRWYTSVIKHPHFGAENTKPALLALSRFHKEGLGGAEKSDELSMKYLSFSKSNAEYAAEIQDLERWWRDDGKKTIMAHFEAEKQKS